LGYESQGERNTNPERRKKKSQIPLLKFKASDWEKRKIGDDNSKVWGNDITRNNTVRREEEMA